MNNLCSLLASSADSKSNQRQSINSNSSPQTQNIRGLQVLISHATLKNL
jgi:hypothetical protein